MVKFSLRTKLLNRTIQLLIVQKLLKQHQNNPTCLRKRYVFKQEEFKSVLSLKSSFFTNFYYLLNLLLEKLNTCFITTKPFQLIFSAYIIVTRYTLWVKKGEFVFIKASNADFIILVKRWVLWWTKWSMMKSNDAVSLNGSPVNRYFGGALKQARVGPTLSPLQLFYGM